METIEHIAEGIRYIRPAREQARTEPVVVLVHGSGGCADVWRPLITNLKSTYAIAVDMQGHGGSSGAPPISIEEWVTFIERFRHLLGVDRIALFGHSLGGAAAQMYAHRYRQNCNAAIIASSGATFTADPERTKLIRRDWEGLKRQFAEGQVSTCADEAARRAARDMIERRNPEVLADDLVVCRSFSSLNWLPEIKTPCLILVAKEDPMTPFEKSLQLYELIPNAELAVVSPGGHSPFIQHPLRYASAIESFVLSVTRGEPAASAPAKGNDALQRPNQAEKI